MSVIVSVVVPTFRRSTLLERCLQALWAQDLAPDVYEIIVVDDAASKETRHQLESWLRRGAVSGRRITYLATTGACGPAAARNLGWRMAEGDIIAFTDDDCIPAASWLKAGVAAFTGAVEAVTGRICVPLPHCPTDYEYSTARLEESEFATANCFYKRAILQELGGFDEQFTVAWREDSDLFFRGLEKSMPWSVSKEAVVVHPVRPASWGISLSQQRKSMFNALLYKKHPHLYRTRIQATPPWRYYGCLGALVCIIISGLCHACTLNILALLVWGLLTAQFCWLRLRHTSRASAHIVEMVVTSALIPVLSIFWRWRGMFLFRVFFL
jgi:glycosyltransferase involved in cell wall biosynthesis